MTLPWTPPRSLPFLERINDYLTFYSKSQPSEQALILDDLVITYGELEHQVDNCAKALLARNIKKGDRVAVLSTPHPDYFILFLAITSIGAIYVGLNPRYKQQELNYVIADSQPSLIFCRSHIGNRSYANELISMTNKIKNDNPFIILNDDPIFVLNTTTSIKDFLSEGNRITNQELAQAKKSLQSSDAAMIVYTSGTTGKPKGALLPHRGLVRCSLVQIQQWDINPIRLLDFLPINHVGCVVDISSYAFIGGGTIIFMEQFDAAGSLSLIEQQKITCWGGVPTTLQMCLDLPNFNDFDLSSVQMIAWSGAAAPIKLIKQLAKVSNNLSNSYGMTETVGSVSFVPLGTNFDDLANTVGKPIEHFEVRVASASNSVVETGQEGEIQVRGDFTMIKYWNLPKATEDTFTTDGWLRTGDLGLLREDGNLQLVGRLKEMFKSGGYNVYPREIELVLESHPSINTAVVVAVPNELYSEVGHAFVVINNNLTISSDELYAYCKNKLANYKIPKVFNTTVEIPLLSLGKIDRREMQQRAIASMKVS